MHCFCFKRIALLGAIYAKATGNWIGAVEMITATAWCGIFYALVGGQPMVSHLIYIARSRISRNRSEYISLLFAPPLTVYK